MYYDCAPEVKAKILFWEYESRSGSMDWEQFRAGSMDWQAIPLASGMAGAAGIEPTTFGFGDRRSTD